MRMLLYCLGFLFITFSTLSSADSTPECRFDPLKAEFSDPNIYEKMASVYQNWVINPNTNGSIRVSRAGGSDPIYPLSIKGLTIRKFLQYEKNKYGINIGWTDNASSSTERASRKWWIQRSTKTTGPLRYGEKIAIGWFKNKSFIRYKSRKWGINLVWSKKPVYEWKVLGGKKGTKVPARSNRVILYNMKHRQPMIYVYRDKGGHIGWPDSKPHIPFLKKLTTGTIGGSSGRKCIKEHGVIAVRVLAGDRDPAAW